MTLRNAAFLLVFLPVFAGAQQMPPPPPPPANSAGGDVRVSILSKPSLELVQAAFRASGLRVAEMLLRIAYDADGRPLNIDIVKSSRDLDLDRAVVDWVKQIRIATSEAGVGLMPFSFIDDSLPDEPVPIPEIKLAELAYKPSLKSVLKGLAFTDLSEASAEVHVDYDPAGKVTAVRLVESSGIESLDKAILAWAKQIRLKPGAAGTGRLPFKFKKT